MQKADKLSTVSWTQFAALLFVAAYVSANLFRVGGDLFILNLNNFIVTPLAIGVTAMAIGMWLSCHRADENRLLWARLAIGWGLWTIAEIWWAVAGLLEQEVPYPSGADLLWLAGYIPMYIALWSRSRSLPRSANREQLLAVTLAGLFFLLATIALLLVPIIRASDPNAPVESALNLAYPLADLVLLLLVLRMFFSYQQGRYAEAWLWLTLGFVMFAVGDLVFSYANSIDAYYPDEKVNLISTFGVDIPYNLSYLLCLVGLVRWRTLHAGSPATEKGAGLLRPVPNAHLVVFGRADDRISTVSANYARLFSARDVAGLTIADGLGLSQDDAATILRDVKKHKPMAEGGFAARTPAGEAQAWISGVTITDSDGGYDGYLLLVRMISQDPAPDSALTEYQRSMVRSLLGTTGVGTAEQDAIRDLIGGYYGELFRVLHGLVKAEGGRIMADAFITEMRSVMFKNDWPLQILPDGNVDARAASLDQLRHALPKLLETAKAFTVRVAEPSATEKALQAAQSRIGPEVARNIAGLAALEA